MSGEMFTSYDDAGRVVSTGRAVNAEEQVPETGGVFMGAIFDGDRFWFPDGAPTPRPPSPEITLSASSVVADGAATVDLLGVPAGARVAMGGAILTAEGGPIQLSTNAVGQNRIVVDAFPAKVWTGNLDGTAY